MKTLDKLITKDMFLNAFDICKSYMDNPRLCDINMLLLKNSFKTCSKNKMEEFYDKWVKNDKLYCNQVFFSSDIVQIPKGINNFREYRFFDIYSMVLYNSIGILFYKLCNNTFNAMSAEKDRVFSFSPTRFIDSKKDGKYVEVKANNDYAITYSKYSKTKEDNIISGTCIIKIDLSKYFDSIIHKKLVELIGKYSLFSTQSEFNIDKEAYDALNFYLDSMMNSKFGIPQGRDNCFSDYFGDIYMKEFDFVSKDLCKSDLLKLKCIIRYVDDITIVYDINNNLNNAEHYKELSKIEQRISRFFLENLNLTINSNKTEYSILKTKKEVTEYIKRNNKKVSSKNDIPVTKKIEKDYEVFKNTLNKFRFNSEDKFKFSLTSQDKENLKLVFDKNFIMYIQKKEIIEELNEIIKKIDFELTIDNMYVMIIFLFLKQKSNKIYCKSFENNITSNMDFKDKRTIHIAMLYYTQELNLLGLTKEIKKHSSELVKDNYGKYLLILSNTKQRKDISLLDNNSIYENITWRFNSKKKREKRFFGESVIPYNLMVESFMNTENINDAQIQQIKNFVFYYRKEEWNLAYNSFYNFFHETCKIVYNNHEDQYNINNIIKDLNKSGILDQQYNLDLLKFADYRNFNTISHPSKNGKSSIKVSKEILDEYIEKISDLIIRIL